MKPLPVSVQRIEPKPTVRRWRARALRLAALSAGIGLMACVLRAAPLTIQHLDPTPFFPKTAIEQPLRQQARLCLDNPGAAFGARAMIQVGDSAPYSEDLGQISSGKSTNTIHIRYFGADPGDSRGLRQNHGSVAGQARAALAAPEEMEYLLHLLLPP